MLRLWAVAVLVAGCADDGADIHARGACKPPLNGTFDTCEAACADNSAAYDTSMMCVAHNPDDSGSATCQAVTTFDGHRGCCDASQALSPIVLRFYACE